MTGFDMAHASDETIVDGVVWRTADFGWGDFGRAELVLEDGRHVLVSVHIDEHWDGTNEWAVATLTADDGTVVSAIDVDRWRRLMDGSSGQARG
jgi:hypothetical protein